MQAWDAYLCALEPHLGKETVDKWLRSFEVVKFDACNLYLKPRDAFQVTWFEEHVRKIAKSSFVNNNSHPIKIHFIHPTKKKILSSEESPLPLPIVSEPLDPHMTIAHFLHEESNRLCVEFLKNLKTGTFNPLFLHGSKGVGKTHLLQAVGHHLKSQGLNVFYVHAETFTEHLVKAIRSFQMQAFRSTYRHPDVLLIDDVHYFARKNATQEEFFHTFNALHQSGKQIILTSHLLPGQMEEIEPRLISRFEWGIVWQVYPLSRQKMEEVLKQRGAACDFELIKELGVFIVENFTTTIAMMRALDALMMRHRSNTPLSLEEGKRLLADLLNEEKKKTLTHETIIKTVAAHFRIGPKDILGKSQTKESAFPRKLAMYFCRQKLHLPYQSIGRIFNRDHSTVISSIQYIEQRSTSDETRCALEELDKNFKS